MFKDIYRMLNDNSIKEDTRNTLILKGLGENPRGLKGYINKFKILTKWLRIQ